MATFSIQLKPDLNKDGTQSIRIRITKDRKHSYFNTGIRITVTPNARTTEWNEEADYRKDNWIRSHRLSKTYNKQLRHDLDALDKLAKANPYLSATQLKNLYTRPEQTGNFGSVVLAFMDEFQERQLKTGRISYAEKLRNAKRILIEFCGTDATDEQMLKLEFVDSFVAWMRNLKRKDKTTPKHGPKSIKTVLTFISLSVKQALNEGRLIGFGNPFSSVEIHVPPVQKPRPAADVYGFLFQQDLTKKPAQFHGRNVFLLQFLLHGARVSEIIKLEWANITDDYVSYLPGKKSRAWKKIPRSEEINTILSYYPREGRYVFPYLPDGETAPTELYRLLDNAKSSVHEALERIAKRFSIPHLSSHMARRSFTDAALKSTKDVYAVQKLVGWSSVALVEKYADEYEQAEKDKASGLIFSTIDFKGKQ